MTIQRRGELQTAYPLHDGGVPVGVDWYFPDTNRLGPSVQLWRFEPGASEGEHRHDDSTDRDLDELYLVISGRLEVDIDGVGHDLGAGDAAYVPAGVPHSAHNPGEVTAEVVLMFGEPGTVPRHNQAGFRARLAAQD
ncbi:hypothetical protein GCM10027515_29470 [Schumannella luteola]|uniref:Mannose-6-phosphate isomerase-like protein (Cupin superfamily) n=1 Tax=Schumannella luteola TaxID=472059 RepID=A0A852YBN9_9MICO|nr:cupin domain-containing protein [Schumannella luteola]NYG99252.1 mannose-6-phosphate isomerase-like protein (cupin superfamily) [Schumannella luteola]TPX05635.1 cupin domain-containing protein [Schumannella luteola]